MTSKPFHPAGLPLLIGSLPVDNHPEAQELVQHYTPEIPLWVQLPRYREEGMMVQFLPGLPGVSVQQDGKTVVDTSSGGFDDALLAFYEEYMAVSEGAQDLDTSRFALSPDTAKGFFELLKTLETSTTLSAVKGQITGPVTLATGLTDHQGRALFYNEQIRDAVVKHLAMKAKWQVRRLAAFGKPVILFFDEPALAGFGSSAFISISKEDIAACLEEVIQAVHEEGGLAGIHVCANADWSLVLDSSADIVSFDAYAYFDRFILYPDLIRRFMADGKLLAWGIVPTLNGEDIEKETSETLIQNWLEKVAKIEALGIDRAVVLSQSLITPSCGTGSLSLPLAEKVLSMTRGVSDAARKIASDTEPVKA